MNACAKAGVGLVAMKTQAGRAGEAMRSAAEAKLEMVDRFLKRGFTDKQAKLKVIWENPQIASICSQMPNLTILSANVAAARDQTKLAREEFDSLRRMPWRPRPTTAPAAARSARRPWAAPCPSMKSCAASCTTGITASRNWPGMTFAGLAEEVRQRLTEVDYSRAEQACPQGLAIAALMRQARELLA